MFSYRRARRNSAGDEISSLLNHEASSMGSLQQHPAQNPLATSEMLLMKPADEEEDGDLSQRVFRGNPYLTQLEASNSTSNTSALENTVIDRLEVSDR